MKSLRFALPLTLAALAACSDQAEQPAPQQSTAAAVPSEDAAPAIPASDAPAQRASRYSAFKDCRLVDSKEDEDWSVSRCSGPAGWSLQLDYGDAREDLRIVRAGEPSQPLGLPYLAGGGFNSLGDTAEWRGTGEGADFAPEVLIVRNHSNRDPESTDKQTALLEVIDLVQACVIAQIPPGPGQNEQARAEADKMERACLPRK